MNIDIVKPIPPKKLTPKIDFQFKSSGRLLIFSLTDKKLNSHIPIGFPMSNPNAIPMVY